MSNLIRFGVSLDRELLTQFDSYLSQKGYENRSEGIRDLIRDALVRQEWEAVDPNEERMAVVSIVYDHHESDLPGKLTELQHERHGVVHSALHIHLDRHNCLEILVLRGPMGSIQDLGNKLISTRGVRHGKMILTTTGKNIH
ncbi:MAG: nickel-responsive transcriptional regulator NikR [Deltaproteobacteria bacterium]|nr:nickel-responsive transcriptional regulator NikR [Candidatus Zymogenaceae bacterium]